MPSRSGHTESFHWRESSRAPGARDRVKRAVSPGAALAVLASRTADLLRGITTRLVQHVRATLTGGESRAALRAATSGQFNPRHKHSGQGKSSVSSPIANPGSDGMGTDGDPDFGSMAASITDATTSTDPGLNVQSSSTSRASVGHSGNASAPDGRLRTIPWVAPARDYLLLAPARPAINRRLLVLLHPVHLAPPAFAAAIGVDRLVATGNWLVLMPAQTAAANNDLGWNWFDPRTAAGAGEAAIVLAAIDQVARRHAIDSDATFIAGMGAGASLAAAIAGNAPHRFAAAAFHSGVAMAATTSALRARRVMKRGPDTDVTENLPAMSHLPTLVIHGTADAVVSPRHADELTRQMLAINGRIAPGAPLPQPTRLETHGDAHRSITQRDWGTQRQILISGLGHAWSGGSETWSGNDAEGPDALELMTRFFEAQSLLPA